jgi:hypothetical protein
MDYIKKRISQLEAQLDDPEILDQLRVEIKLESYRECMQGLVKKSDSLPCVRKSLIDFLQRFWENNYDTKGMAFDDFIDDYIKSLNAI